MSKNKTKFYENTLKTEGKRIADINEFYYNYLTESSDPKSYSNFETYYKECVTNVIKYYGIYLPPNFKNLASLCWNNRNKKITSLFNI